MKANELRIGNYVKCGDKIIMVESVDVSGINITCDTGEYGGLEYDYSFDDFWGNGKFVIKPIPLTEEWLLKFGFEYYIDKTWLRKGIFSFFFDSTSDNSISKVVEICVYESHNIVKIQFVHQLQNLYFALTGDELN